MTDKLFTVAGITVHNGNAKVRFTDDLSRRVKQFAKGGATRVDFVSLPVPMNKIDALRYLLTLGQFASAEDQATVSETLADREREARKGEVRVKVTPSLDSIKDRSTETEPTV